MKLLFDRLDRIRSTIHCPAQLLFSDLIMVPDIGARRFVLSDLTDATAPLPMNDNNYYHWSILF